MLFTCKTIDVFFHLPVDEVRMWVFEEILPTGKKLSESINEENVRTEAR